MFALDLALLEDFVQCAPDLILVVIHGRAVDVPATAFPCQHLCQTVFELNSVFTVQTFSSICG